ncbi:MAG TPA: helix-hairpin-helix domain-containing protein, partial [Saprospiraceae bacterium]
MKHEYHYTVSRTDRVWLIVFVSLLLGWELVKPLLPSPERELLKIEMPLHTDSTESSGNIRTRKSKYYDTYQKRYYPDRTYSSYSNEGIAQKRPINIMQATWQELRAIGFQSKIATNIERYIDAGGIIKNENQLMKIYGMDSTQWAIVAPYILFPEVKNETNPFQSSKKENNNETRKILDINKASATDLETLPGIGTVLAE